LNKEWYYCGIRFLYRKGLFVMSVDLIGSIVKIYRNSGIISTNFEGKTVEVLFYIFPDMLVNNKLYLSKKVKFKLGNRQIRRGKMKIAFDVRSSDIDKEQFFDCKPIDISSLESYQDFIFRDFYDIDNQKDLKKLIEQDNMTKELTLKWVLFIEHTIKDLIVNIAKNYDISSMDIYNDLNKSKSTKSIHGKLMKKIKTDSLFRSEFEFLTIKRDAKDSKNFDIVDVPLSLYLEKTTLDELGNILKELLSSTYSNLIRKDKSVAFFKNISQIFLELSDVRNACAHGNPLIPLILDDKYMPNERFDLESCIPEFNSGEDVSKWELFNPIRYYTRQLVKMGIAPLYQGGLQSTGLYTAKYILINPVRRSFFSFVFIMNYLFTSEFVDENELLLHEFQLDFINLMPLEGMTKEMSSDVFTKYPKKKPVTDQIFELVYFLMDEKFFHICDVLLNQ